LHQAAEAGSNNDEKPGKLRQALGMVALATRGLFQGLLSRDYLLAVESVCPAQVLIWSRRILQHVNEVLRVLS
jgi:hypothetical protein